jgi:hypothetical protein
MKLLSWLLLVAVLAGNARACIWDAESLAREEHRSHDLATTILGEPAPADDPVKLQARIKDLEASRDETNADWWNNLAGAYLRLNQPDVAVKLLEPVVGRFPNDYGIHANLGTAYHLLGHYADAEKEIARDLEINPEAHFGLEKYHLALLQYLVRDKTYQARHVYVDEFSRAFQQGVERYIRESEGKLDAANTNGLEMKRINELTKQIAGEPGDEKTNSWEWEEIQDLKGQGYVPPPYRFKWDLAADTNFIAGVIYMAQMNPREPACFEMLGIAASTKHDFNLTLAAYEKAVMLGSLKSELLREKDERLRHFIHESYKENLIGYGMGTAVILFLLCLVSCIGIKIWQWRMAARK